MIMNALKFKNKKVVFTGKIEGKTREGIELLAQSIGLNVQKAVSKNTDFVIFGSDVGQTKLDRAMKLNIPVLKFKEFAKHVTYFEDKILQKFNSIKKENKESIIEFVLQYPFLINHISQPKLVKTILKKCLIYRYFPMKKLHLILVFFQNGHTQQFFHKLVYLILTFL